MKRIIFAVFWGFLLFSCASTQSSNNSDYPRGPYFSGNGGKGISIAVLQPSYNNLPSNEYWLSTFIQSVLTSDFNRYTAMSVFDRQNLDTILSNQELSMSGDFSDDDYISIGKLTNARYIVMGNIQKIQQTNTYLFDLAITNSETGERLASFPPASCSFIDIQNTAIIQNAFEDVVAQLNIELTESGKQAIHYTNQPSITATAALSKGIIAQNNGRMGEALSYYYNAASFMPNMAEVNNRISVLSSSVASGNIGESARNLIALRNSWQNILDETDTFLREHIPFEIIYDPRLKQEGGINYSSGTVDLRFTIMTKPTEGINMINDVLKGLKRTGRQEEWGFQFWPFGLYEFDNSNNRLMVNTVHHRYVHDRHINGPVHYENSLFGNYFIVTVYYSRPITIDVNLLNDEGEILSAINTSLECRMGTVSFTNEDYYNVYEQNSIRIKPESLKKTLIFKNVDANKITDTMTIRIVSVDGIDVETVGIDGYIKISTGRL